LRKNQVSLGAGPAPRFSLICFVDLFRLTPAYTIFIALAQSPVGFAYSEVARKSIQRELRRPAQVLHAIFFPS
jgi:hypothetical protein